MAVPLHWLVREALAAPHHVQVAITRVTPPSSSPGAATVVGEVVRVFRGPLSPGTPVQVAVHALRDGDHPPPSAILWLRFNDLLAARVLEVWAADGDDDLLHVVGSQCTLLASPSDEPRHPLNEADARGPTETTWERRRALMGLVAAVALVLVCIVGGFGIALSALMR